MLCFLRSGFSGFGSTATTSTTPAFGATGTAGFGAGTAGFGAGGGFGAGLGSTPSLFGQTAASTASSAFAFKTPAASTTFGASGLFSAQRM